MHESIAMFAGKSLKSAVVGWLVITCLGAVLPVRARDGAPKGLAEMETALGIEDSRLRRLEALHAVARVDGPRGTFTMETSSQRPLRVELRQRSDRGEAHYRLTRLGPEAWSEKEGVWREAPSSLGAFIRGHEFHLEVLELSRRFTDFRDGGRGTVETDGESLPCHRILMTRKPVTGLDWGTGGPDAADSPDASVCLAVAGEERGRPLELRFVPAPGEAPIAIRYTDWQWMDGVAFFGGFVLTQGDDTYAYRYTDIEPTWTPAEADLSRSLSWSVGRWQGSRRAAEEPEPAKPAVLEMTVEPLWTSPGERPFTPEGVAERAGGAYLRRLAVRPAEGGDDDLAGVYRGFAVEIFDGNLGRWVRQYTNSVTRRFTRLEGEVYGPRSVWQRPSQDGPRRAVLESELVPDGLWRRTMYRSEDGGGTWRILWQDELRRNPPPTP